MGFKGESIISINDLSKDQIVKILDTAAKIEKNPQELLKGKIVATLFYEPSTRTRLSFESAAKQLGAKVIGFADKTTSSDAKGESLSDTIKTVSLYSDLIAMRHPVDGAARLASTSTKKPIINGGDGANQHPTQTLLDMYTIQKTQVSISNLHVALVGDLKFGRTVHSLAIALSHFNTRLYFVNPKQLPMPDDIKTLLDKRGIKYTEHQQISEVVNEVDILYMTRIQKERFPDPDEYEAVKDVYVLQAKDLLGVRSNMKVLHPLPRVNEIATDVDKTSHAHYFEQMHNGIPIRQALMCLCLGAIE